MRGDKLFKYSYGQEKQN